MLDAVVLLTPALVLGVLLLLGFAGCSFDPSAPSAPALYIHVRVPTALTVTEIVYRAVDPGGVVDTVTVANPAPGSTEGADNLFFHRDGDPVVGGWTVACRVTVSENGATAQRGAQASPTVDGSDTHPTASFRASGTPSGADFTVVYTGLT